MKKIFILLLSLFLLFQINIIKGANEFYVTNTNPYGDGSFSWAIDKALESGGVIKFNIPTSDRNFNGKYWTITLKSNIPEISKKIIIDGSSQTQNFGDLNPDGPEIVIDGGFLTSDAFFKFKYDGFEINGLILKNFLNTDYIKVEGVKGTIKDIHIEKGNTGIHLFKASSVKIFNVILKNLDYGIYFYYSNNNIVDNANIYKTNFGIRFYFSSGDEIKNSYISSSKTGIRIFYNSIKNKVHDNTFESNEDGIFLRDSFGQKNDIYNNKFINNIYGIHLYTGTGSLIYENEFIKNKNGIYLEVSSSNNSVKNNSFVENEFSVKFFNGCENNEIVGNNFINNEFGIYFLEKSSTKNRFSRNIMIGNKFNITLNGGNEGIEPPKILFSKILGKSILLSVESKKSGKVEVFLSDNSGSNCETFIKDKEINEGKNIFYLPTDLEIKDKHFLVNLTENLGNTSEFTQFVVNDRAPFIDLILKKTFGGERGDKAEFTLNIKNSGDEDVNNAKFKIKIPNIFKDITILTLPKGAKWFIENNFIIIENLNILKNSVEVVKFSFSIPENIEINTTYALQGEIEYSPYEGITIIEKSDEDGIDDGIPNSFLLDEETKFVITGKPLITLSTVDNVSTSSNSTFNLLIEIKNSGNYLEKDLKLKISNLEDFDFINSNIGQYKRDENSFYLNIDTIKENEKINLSLTLKTKTFIDDKVSKISISLLSPSIDEIKKDISIFIKGEGRENLSLNVDVPDSVMLYSNLNMKIFIKNSGTKEAKDKILTIKYPNNFRLVSNYQTKDNVLEIMIDRVGINEEIKFEVSFKAMSGCQTLNTFSFTFDNLVKEKDVKVECLRIYHHPIIGGYPDGTFKPDNLIRRVEVAVILSNTFLLSRESKTTLPKDIKSDYWGKDYILNVISYGLMGGYPDGTFNPDRFLKRSEASAIIFKILNLSEDRNNYFKDIDDKYWAKGIIGAVYKKGIISGYKDGRFRGENGITRAEFLTMLLKAIGRGGANLGSINIFNDLKETHWAYNYIIEATTPHILINPNKIYEININGIVYPIFEEKQNSIINFAKIGEIISVSIPFLYNDLREVKIEVTKISIKIP